jgi:Tfp pilus assembly protein PilF
MKKVNALFVFACMALGFLLTACAPTEPYHQERVEREEVKDADYYFKDGMKDFRKGEYREAIEDFQRVVQMQPNYTEAYFYMGQSYEKIGKRETAEKAYENAIAIDPRYVPVREAFGLLEYDQKEYRKAETQLHAARELGSTNPWVFYTIGRIDLSEKECKRSIQAFKEAIRLDPDFREAREWLDKAEDRCGRPHSAESREEKSLKGGGKAIKPEDF